jgi:hypothetical protein
VLEMGSPLHVGSATAWHNRIFWRNTYVYLTYASTSIFSRPWYDKFSSREYRFNTIRMPEPLSFSEAE